MKKEVIVIGAGFSGMTSAYFLNKAGYKVEVFEKELKPGGLIRTVDTPWGQCEVAANGILNSMLLEDMAKDIGLILGPAKKLSGKRYIFRKRPRRWPLSLNETLKLFFKFIFANRKPREQETVLHWGHRVLGRPATTYLLAPALQGIYAGDISKMSASLVLARFFKKTKNKAKARGLVSPKEGMSEFFTKTESYLKGKGVKFNYGKEINLLESGKNKICVLATSAKATAKILEPLNSKIAMQFKSIEMLSLVKITNFYKEKIKKIEGFGILFPRDQGFKSLGVLFNNFIFQRSSTRFFSESSILGGALDKNILDLSDACLLKTTREERAKLLGDAGELEGHHIQRWPLTLPNYTVTLEKNLKEMASGIKELEKGGIFITGNFLGGIGLSQLLERSFKLPERVMSLHG